MRLAKARRGVVVVVVVVECAAQERRHGPPTPSRRTTVIAHWHTLGAYIYTLLGTTRALIHSDAHTHTHVKSRAVCVFFNTCFFLINTFFL